ncbi:MAG: fucose isomerase, partial [Treponema sp.]|nr:fucose isomerase [Treponema sp.]
MNQNIPEVTLGLIAVSRDCFPLTLSETRRSALAAACAKRGFPVFEAKTTVENEKDALKAVDEV